MSISLKLSFQNELRRLRVNTPLKYSELVKNTMRLYPALERSKVQFSYVDDENETVTFSSDAELIEAMEVQGTGKPFKFEILLSRPAETACFNKVIHVGVSCDGCGAKPLAGPRFKCTIRGDCDLCATCEAKSVQPFPMMKIYHPNQKHESVPIILTSSHHPNPRRGGVGPKVHRGVICDGCQAQNFTGCRYKCSVRNDFDLCEACELKEEQPHAMLKVYVPQQFHHGRINIFYEGSPLNSLGGAHPHQHPHQHPQQWWHRVGPVPGGPKHKHHPMFGPGHHDHFEKFLERTLDRLGLFPEKISNECAASIYSDESKESITRNSDTTTDASPTAMKTDTPRQQSFKGFEHPPRAECRKCYSNNHGNGKGNRKAQCKAPFGKKFLKSINLTPAERKLWKNADPMRSRKWRPDCWDRAHIAKAAAQCAQAHAFAKEREQAAHKQKEDRKLEEDLLEMCLEQSLNEECVENTSISTSTTTNVNGSSFDVDANANVEVPASDLNTVTTATATPAATIDVDVDVDTQQWEVLAEEEEEEEESSSLSALACEFIPGNSTSSGTSIGNSTGNNNGIDVSSALMSELDTQVDAEVKDFSDESSVESSVMFEAAPWHRELEVLAAMGFYDVGTLLPLLQKHVPNPSGNNSDLQAVVLALLA